MPIFKSFKYALGLCVLALVGCTSTGSSNFKEMSSAYREVVEQYSNDNILLNIVRVSQNMPMSFLDIPSVVGSGAVTQNANLSAQAFTNAPASVPGFFSAANTANDSSSITAGIGLSVNNSFSFTQSSLDNSSFMTSFYKEIPLDVLDFKGTERLRPKTIDYMLLIDNVQGITSDRQTVLKVENDPLSANYDHFQEVFKILMELGLRVEKSTTKTPIGPAIEASKIGPSSFGDAIIDGVGKGVFSIDEVTKGNVKYFQASKIESASRLCINRYRSQEIFGSLLSPKNYCANSERLPKSEEHFGDYLSWLKKEYPSANNIELSFKIRSTGNVFDFLGNILIAQTLNPNKQVLVFPSHKDVDTILAAYNKPTPLLRIYRNDSSVPAATKVTYKGITYSIAANDDSHSKLVIEYISTLLTFAKVPGSIPPSPAVIVR